MLDTNGLIVWNNLTGIFVCKTILFFFHLYTFIQIDDNGTTRVVERLWPDIMYRGKTCPYKGAVTPKMRIALCAIENTMK